MKMMITTMASQSTMIVDNQYPPIISMIFDYNYINSNTGNMWLLLPMDHKLCTSGTMQGPGKNDIMIGDYHF